MYASEMNDSIGPALSLVIGVSHVYKNKFPSAMFPLTRCEKINRRDNLVFIIIKLYLLLLKFEQNYL